MSPTPSPAGSVGSIGSNGSNSSGEGNHSQNGRHAPTASVTSPVSVSIPQRIHSVMAQHVSSTSKLVNSIDMWDKADSLTSDYQGKIPYTLFTKVISYVATKFEKFRERLCEIDCNVDVTKFSIFTRIFYNRGFYLRSLGVSQVRLFLNYMYLL